MPLKTDPPTDGVQLKQNGKGPLQPIVSLFSGAGGLDLGFSEAGYQTVLAMDYDPAACLTYKVNHPTHRVIKADLAKVKPGYVLDRLAEEPYPVRPVGVIGGPPCQAFSLSNVHKKADDPRLRLPENYAAILRELNRVYSVDFFVFENVLGLRHKGHQELFSYFKELFSKAGFCIFEGELDAKDFGVPQERKRVFVVGFNKAKYTDMQFKFPLGKMEAYRTVGEAIRHLAEPVPFSRDLTPASIPVHPNHWCMAPKSQKFFNGFLKEGDIKGRPFRVLAWDKPSWTVAYGHREVHIHPSGKRRLSIYEAMLLQGFPSTYTLYGTLSDQIRLVSDAVPPPLGRVLAEAIRHAIETYSGRKKRKATSKDSRSASHSSA